MFIWCHNKKKPKFCTSLGFNWEELYMEACISEAVTGEVMQGVARTTEKGRSSKEES
jgi:hypothetical protein